MKKHPLHRTTKSILALGPWFFLALTIVSGFTAVTALRNNNEKMIKLRSAVYAADENNSGTEQSLKTLQAYVTSHMNTDLSSGPSGVYPPIQLKYTYDRIINAESDQLAQTNTTFYTTAQNYCEQLLPTQHLMSRVDCTENYLQTHDTQHQIAPVADALYKFDFVSPVWSPDLAGWSLVVAAVSGFLFLVNFIGYFIARRRAK